MRIMSSNLGADDPKPYDSCFPFFSFVSLSALLALSRRFRRKFLFRSYEKPQTVNKTLSCFKCRRLIKKTGSGHNYTSSAAIISSAVIMQNRKDQNLSEQNSRPWPPTQCEYSAE